MYLFFDVDKILFFIYFYSYRNFFLYLKNEKSYERITYSIYYIVYYRMNYIVYLRII